ncbi:MAG TPA: hypothetical protein VG318_13440 [Actinomycetota bacterium]|nr:hypothetical protein [Actinomycetota bacterium]
MSGLYKYQASRISPRLPLPGAQGAGASVELAPTLFPFLAEELRLDVDGRYPQLAVSGMVPAGFSRVSWIAKLVAAGTNHWTGTIFYKEGSSAFPYTTVDVVAAPSWVPANRAVTVVFSAGSVTRTRIYKFTSPYFHNVDFEFDNTPGEVATTSVNTCAHPNRPSTLPCETLSIPTVFERAGFGVTTSPGGTVPMAKAGSNLKWSDQEMHDAMQAYWSKFSATSKWAMWVFFASLHETGTSLGGIMFDQIGPNHRQGTAIFNDAFISQPPGGDLAPAAWVQRMIFWTACHEMGHSFNLAHSWQKAMGGRWLPGLVNEPEARSFMNYPYYVTGGQAAFFASFQYRFSDAELMFLRHAPGKFVQMGNAAWFDNHGFSGANVAPEARLTLELRVNRNRRLFEFMEPVTVELKLTNVTDQPQLLDVNVLKHFDSMVVIVKKDGKSARQVIPFAQYCYMPDKMALLPGESVYQPLLISGGQGGWDLAEPGRYVVQIALRNDDEDIVSNPLPLRVAPPRSYDEELVAQDFFVDDVARTFAFGGSEVLSSARDTLMEVIERTPDRRAALHSSLVLGSVARRDYKVLVEDPEAEAGIGMRTRAAQPENARELLDKALLRRPHDAAETLGHIRYRRHVERLSDWLADSDEPAAAADAQDVLYETLSSREVQGRKVLGGVLDEVARKRDAFRSEANGGKRAKTR